MREAWEWLLSQGHGTLSLLGCDHTKPVLNRDYLPSTSSKSRRAATVVLHIFFLTFVNFFFSNPSVKENVAVSYFLLCVLRLYSGRKTNKKRHKRGTLLRSNIAEYECGTGS